MVGGDGSAMVLATVVFDIPKIQRALHFVIVKQFAAMAGQRGVHGECGVCVCAEWPWCYVKKTVSNFSCISFCRTVSCSRAVI